MEVWFCQRKIGVQIPEEGTTDAGRQKQYYMSSTNTYYVQGTVQAVGDMMVNKMDVPALKELTS